MHVITYCGRQSRSAKTFLEKLRLGSVQCVSAQRGWWTKPVKEEIYYGGLQVNFDGMVPEARNSTGNGQQSWDEVAALQQQGQRQGAGGSVEENFSSFRAKKRIRTFSALARWRFPGERHVSLYAVGSTLIGIFGKNLANPASRRLLRTGASTVSCVCPEVFAKRPCAEAIFPETFASVSHANDSLAEVPARSGDYDKEAEPRRSRDAIDES
nr:hypothetical protein CFP56_69076 [Quercus suber]